MRQGKDAGSCATQGAKRGLAGAARLFLLTVAAPAAAQDGACPAKGGETVAVAAVEARLELRLADGRLIRLAGLDPPAATPADPDRAETATATVQTMLAQGPLTLAIVAPRPDRWGRLAAFAFQPGDASRPGGLAAGLVAAGLGRYLAEPAARPCRDALLAGEGSARSAKLGLWADPYYAVLAVDDRAGFAEKAGTIVQAEGLLTAVQPSPYRTTLRFAAPAGREASGGFMLVATIPPRVMKTFQARQVEVKTLIGRRLRVRGLLDLRFGPRIELQTADELEVLATPAVDAGRPAPN